MQALCAAIRFLTIIPMPGHWGEAEQSLRGSPPWYPVVGLLLGLILTTTDMLLRWLLPMPVASCLLLVVMIALTGALHLDGLADSADAFFSHRDRENMLTIMKDSRSGPMGVMAVFCLLALKLTILFSLPTSWRAPALILMPVAGRSTILQLIGLLPYARPTAGTAAFTKGAGRRSSLLVALGILVCVALTLVPIGVAVLITLICGAAGYALAAYYRIKIGGYTGDTLGAACELSETIPALVLLILLHRGTL
ncbi:adenosylcobinamide-GDP ribazoletransferase [Trichloromonas sp.]|uniref:adenosylcobinamide-GDP ribazoletransferase n=1 Tax=Trichloromonas sp. TaxID=3069249 RepID=UPI001DF77A6E|nr:adenosylcobinamide-GDP ribazoletransferase [Desulfuromonadaceae bacterium]MDY0269865.1 adenosylcobinamide-GDP ribazoletransferase [Trichloromonas sp.]